LGHVQKASKSAFKSNIMVSSDLLPPATSTSSGMTTPENTEEDTDDHEPRDEGHIQMEHSSD